MTTFGVLSELAVDVVVAAVDLLGAPGDALDAEPQPAARSALAARAASNVNLREATTEDC